MVTITLLIILPIIVGLMEGLMDKINFHYEGSIFSKFNNQNFYDPYLSWKNKYKEDLKTPKFIGSTTIFVFLTDAWHFFKWLKNRVLHIYILYLFYILSFNIITFKMNVIVLLIVISYPLFERFGFWLGFKKLFNV